MTTEFILIRHGETIWNAEARMQGQQDSPLTPRGKAQARAVAERLCDEVFDRIYSSDLQRVVKSIRSRRGFLVVLLLEMTCYSEISID